MSQPRVNWVYLRGQLGLSPRSIGSISEGVHPYPRLNDALFDCKRERAKRRPTGATVVRCNDCHLACVYHRGRYRTISSIHEYAVAVFVHREGLGIAATKRRRRNALAHDLLRLNSTDAGPGRNSPIPGGYRSTGARKALSGIARPNQWEDVSGSAACEWTSDSRRSFLPALVTTRAGRPGRSDCFASAAGVFFWPRRSPESGAFNPSAIVQNCAHTTGGPREHLVDLRRPDAQHLANFSHVQPFEIIESEREPNACG